MNGGLEKQAHRDTVINLYQPTPVTIIGGFLGAGKTSLLSHILSSNHQKRLGVLVNDFGKLNVDSESIVNIEGETVSLANGCICCTIRDDLLKEVMRLLQRPEQQRPDHIIIETSGVSDPGLVAHTFQMAAIEGIVQLDSIISLVDSDQILKQHEEFRELAARQIKVADIVVINKVDLVSAENLQQVMAMVTGIAPLARTLQTSHGRIPFELLFNSNQHHSPQIESSKLPSPLPSSQSLFESWTVTSEKPFSLIAIRKLVEDMPPEVYRVKGFLQLEGDDDECAQLQMTGGRAWLRMDIKKQTHDPVTSLVFIAKQGEVNIDALTAMIERCQSAFNAEKLATSTQTVRIKNTQALNLVFG